MRPASALREVGVFGVHHSHMPCECIVAAEGLLFLANWTMHFLLPGIVDGVLVPSEIVRPRENGVAGLARGGVNPFALQIRVSVNSKIK